MIFLNVKCMDYLSNLGLIYFLRVLRYCSVGLLFLNLSMKRFLICLLFVYFSTSWSILVLFYADTWIMLQTLMFLNHILQNDSYTSLTIRTRGRSLSVTMVGGSPLPCTSDLIVVFSYLKDLWNKIFSFVPCWRSFRFQN